MRTDWRKELESGDARKSAPSRAISTLPLVQCGTGQKTRQLGPFLREPGAFKTPPGNQLPVKRETSALGTPLDIRQVAALIGCSPWTVRQTLIPRGLPFFRFAASGRLTFYEGQVVRWIESQQQGGNK